MRVEILLQLLHFPADAFDLHRLFTRGRREAAQFGHVAFQRVDHALFLFFNIRRSCGCCGLRLGRGWRFYLRDRFFGSRPRTRRRFNYVLRRQLGGRRFSRRAASLLQHLQLLQSFPALLAGADFLPRGVSPGILLAHCTTATESVPQISRTRSTSSRSACTALPESKVASDPSCCTRSNETLQRPG